MMDIRFYYELSRMFLKYRIGQICPNEGLKSNLLKIEMLNF